MCIHSRMRVQREVYIYICVRECVFIDIFIYLAVCVSKKTYICVKNPIKRPVLRSTKKRGHLKRPLRKDWYGRKKKPNIYGKRSRIYAGIEAKSSSYIFGFFSRIYSASFPVYIRLLFPASFSVQPNIYGERSRIYAGIEAKSIREKKHD